MVDNFDKIRDLLKFESDDDYYFMQILQRKKDHKEGTRVSGTNNNSRLIKAYYIDGLSHYDFVKPEVIEMCKIFNARAGLNLNKRSFEASALHHLKKCTDQILNKVHNKAYKAYPSIAGAYLSGSDKVWILDIDDMSYTGRMITVINENCMPKGDKYITTIPSKVGQHMLCKPFDLKMFSSFYPDIEVHKNNPTNVYIP